MDVTVECNLEAMVAGEEQELRRQERPHEHVLVIRLGRREPRRQSSDGARAGEGLYERHELHLHVEPPAPSIPLT